MTLIRFLLLANLCFSSFFSYSEQETDKPMPTKLTASEILAQASPSAWRTVKPAQLAVLTLATGKVYIELNPTLAPNHVKQLQMLAKTHFYKGKSMYRFVEGFVAQGGAGEDKTTIKPLKNEFFHTSQNPLKLDYTLAKPDGYAPRSGFLNGFAVAQNQRGTHTWQTHCTGALGMARGNNPDSGSSEIYFVLGHAPRYLDQNITLFGRVLSGMEHLQQLSRQPTKGQVFNPITNLQLASQLKTAQQPQFKVLKTSSTTFADYVNARKNRQEAWFVTTPNYIDVCAVTIPTKRVK